MSPLVKRSIMQVGLGTAGAVMLLVLGASSGRAQSAASDLITPSQGENRDFFSERSDNPMGGLHDLIHQLNYGSVRSPEEFRRQQQQSINSAAEAFRTRQLQLLEQQQAQPTVTPLPSASEPVSEPVAP